MRDALVSVLELTNETLTTIIAITAASMLLYNLVRNLQDRVTRAAAVLLGCVTIASVTDSLTGLDSDASLIETWFRLQWIGVAFTPAAMFHLADALLATTGLISRGRRRKVARVLYIFSAVLAWAAAFTNLMITDLAKDPVYYMRPGPLFGLYTAYFVVACFVSMRLVWRARKRCLTKATRRRMTYFYAAFLSPALGLYPYSLLFESFGSGQSLPLLPLLVMFNLANVFIVVMLVFMSYPLSFFGTNKPDRLVKTELLEFLLRGPLTASALLAVLLTVPRVSEGSGIRDNSLLIPSTIAVLLGMQWLITASLPMLENLLIYTKDQQEARQMRQISERLLTRADIRQLEEAVLAAACDQLRSPSAFIASLGEGGAQLEQVIGDVPDQQDILKAITQEFPTLAHAENGRSDIQYDDTGIFKWRSFWLYPLRQPDSALHAPLLGLLGVWMAEPAMPLADEQIVVLDILTQRAAKVLADQRLQGQVFETLNTLVSEMENMRYLDGISRYGQIQATPLIDSKEVHSALRDFWGGPHLSESSLLSLQVVQEELSRQGGTPTRALQSILSRAIESLKPSDERNRTTPEWILYNILEMRYMQGKKVRDVARQLFMSEPDFYRKQKIAIEEVARRISEMERSQQENGSARDTDIWAADA